MTLLNHTEANSTEEKIKFFFLVEKKMFEEKCLDWVFLLSPLNTTILHSYPIREIPSIVLRILINLRVSVRIDLFSLYILFSHFRPRDATRGNSFFQMSSYARANLRITNEKTKGKFPWGHHVVQNWKTKCTSWKGLFLLFISYSETSRHQVACHWQNQGLDQIHSPNIRLRIFPSSLYDKMWEFLNLF